MNQRILRASVCFSLLSSVVSGSTGEAPPSESWTVEAGNLELRIEASPWRMGFTDPEGGVVLAEHPGRGTSPTGALGFQAGGPPLGDGAAPLLPPPVDGTPEAPMERSLGWLRATKVTHGTVEADGSWRGVVETTDPLGARFEVTAHSVAEGTIRVEARVVGLHAERVSATGVAFVANEDEIFTGFGERGNAVDQRGRTVEHYVGEGPYQFEEYPFLIAVVPKWGIRWREDATYYPIPWLLSSRGYGVSLDRDALSYHRLGADDPGAWSIEVEDSTLAFTVYAGPTPAEALERYTKQVGRQPDPADWFFGPWVQPEREDPKTQEERFLFLRDEDVPVTVANTKVHYLPCGDQQGNEDVERERARRMHALGHEIVTYFNPMICADYQPAFGEAQSAGVLAHDRLGQTYLYPYTTSTVFIVSQFDFTHPGAAKEYGKLVGEALDHGYDGWMEDFGEYTPLDAVAHDGTTGTEWHNRYPRDYHCGVQEAVAGEGRPLGRFVRSGWTGSAACSPLVWGGDPTSSFGFDGLESSLYQALTIGMSGVGYWGSDVGGFFALGRNELSDENLDRWIEFGAVSPLFLSRYSGIAIPEKERPQVWDPKHLPIWRRYSKWRTQLFPYVLAAAMDYQESGIPLMRHGILTHPDDPRAARSHNQFHFGPDLLVAPVLAEGVRERELYVPEGTWVDWWRSVDYDESDGSFSIGTVKLVEGAGSHTLPAPIGELPMLVSAGSVLPMLPPDVHSLSERGEDETIIRRSDRDGALRLLAFPHDQRAARFNRDESIESDARDRRWILRIDGKRERRYELQASLAALESPWEPCEVLLDGIPLGRESWEWDAPSLRLKAVFETDSGTLEVQSCPPA